MKRSYDPCLPKNKKNNSKMVKTTLILILGMNQLKIFNNKQFKLKSLKMTGNLDLIQSKKMSSIQTIYNPNVNIFQDLLPNKYHLKKIKFQMLKISLVFN
jgi:hypothetical protein